jgi:hypothetical protein
MIYPGQEQQSSKTKLVKRTIDDRAPQICSTCGHYRQLDTTYKDKHDIQGKCQVHEDAYSSSNNRSLKGWCSCSECVTAAESVSYCKPIISEPLRGLSACTRCGHYRNVGHFKDQHEKNKCNVPASEIRGIKYQGWCSCDRCVSLATERGYQQPLKLRKSSS